MHHRITALSMTFWTIPWSPKPWLVRIVFIWAFPFLIYKGIRIGRAHKGRGDNYDLRIRKQTGADSHVPEALLLYALPVLPTLQKLEELPER